MPSQESLSENMRSKAIDKNFPLALLLIYPFLKDVKGDPVQLHSAWSSNKLLKFPDTDSRRLAIFYKFKKIELSISLPCK